MLQNDARDRPTRSFSTHRRKVYELAHSVVVLERGGIARIERDGRTEYGGPLPDKTIAALEEVAADG